MRIGFWTTPEVRLLTRPFAETAVAALSKIRYVLAAIDDTLTHEGPLPSQTYLALARWDRLLLPGSKPLLHPADMASWPIKAAAFEAHPQLTAGGP
jgi:hypothetical protein